MARLHGLILAALLLLGNCAVPSPVLAVCYSVPITGNTPTGIAGCERWGEGVASYYGSGTGAAMNFCTWTLRHTVGCGSVVVTANGRSVTIPLLDFCDCWTGTSNERIIDLQAGVLPMLGLDPARGLYEVTVYRPTAKSWTSEGAFASLLSALSALRP